MSDYNCCPNCGREAIETFSSNYFPVYKCLDCEEKYCEECGGSECPACGSTNYTTVGKGYAQ